MTFLGRFKLHNMSQTTRRWAIALLVFTLITAFHMGPSFTNCGDTVLGKPGDHTAGIIYNSWATGAKPLAGFSQKTNFPYGEDLFQPVSFTSIIPTTIQNTLSKPLGASCSWNVVVLSSYMSGALAMFGLVYALTKSQSIALFAGYAATFTPYHAFASQGQIAGLINAGFILAIWQFLTLYEKPTRKKGVVLGGLLGIQFYVDGYFILFSLLLLSCFWLLMLYSFVSQKNKIKQNRLRIRVLIITSMTCFLFLLPLIFIKLHYSERVSAFLGGTRNAIEEDALKFSAEPYMYLLPPPASIAGGQFSQSIQTSIFKKDSKPGLLFIGLSISFLSIYALYSWLRNKKSYSFSTLQIAALQTSFVVGLVAFLVSLKPYFIIFGFKLIMPSYVIIKLTESWRVFGRLYMLVSIATVMCASIGLLMIRKKQLRYFPLIMSVVFLVTTLEFRSFYINSDTKTFSYSQAPAVYSWLTTQPSIKGVAEYPLDEPPQGNYLSEYYTFQTISDKPLLNSMLPNSKNAGLRRSIAGLNDPQTIPVLKALSIDIVNARFSTDSSFKNKYLREIYTHENEEQIILKSYEIIDTDSAKYALIMPDIAYFQLNTDNNYKTTYSLGQNTKLESFLLPDANPEDWVNFHFEVKSKGKDRSITILQNSSVVWTGVIGSDFKNINFLARSDRELLVFIEDTPEEKDRLLLELRNPQVSSSNKP